MKPSRRPVRAVLPGVLLSLLLTSNLSSQAATVAVTSLADTGEGTLRAALESLNAGGGEGVVDLQGLSGAILLASPLPPVTSHLRLLGPNAGDLHLNGQGQWPLLSFAAGTTNEVHRLILTNALATGYRHGAAISNAGSLLLHSCVLAGNRNQYGWGGAIYNQGQLQLLDSLLAGNRAEGEPLDQAKLVSPGGGGAGLGGAVFHDAGTWVASNCTFRGNAAVGGDGGDLNGGYPGGAAMGGAFFSRTGVVELWHCRFEGNTARGGQGRNEEMFGGNGGGAFGGAGLAFQADVHVGLCEFLQNRAEGGAPGAHTDFIFGGNIGVAGLGEGGALSVWGGSLRLHQSLFQTNHAIGSVGGGSKNGGAGAPGRGGALAVRAGNVTVERSLWTGNRARAGHGGGGRFTGNGGAGLGGAVAGLSGELLMENCTLSDNQAQGGDTPEGAAAAGTPGLSAGGAIAVVALTTNVTEAPRVDLRFCTVVSNACVPSAAVYFFGAYRVESGAISGGGLYEDGGRVRLAGVLLAGNQSRTNADSGGSLESIRANLIQAPGSTLGLQPHDLVGLDPKLGPLANQGGLWASYSLQPGSPALDVLPGLEGPSVDHRGKPRPAGAGWDLGAFELQAEESPPSRFGVAHLDPQARHVLLPVHGVAGTRHQVEASSDLEVWTPIGTVTTGEEFQEAVSAGPRFYRLRTL